MLKPTNKKFASLPIDVVVDNKWMECFINPIAAWKDNYFAIASDPVPRAFLNPDTEML